MGLARARVPAMTLKALILEFVLVTVLAVVLIFLLTIGAVQLIDRIVGPADQPATIVTQVGV
jgi:hypothetical protein